ncbi:HAD family hydrolase [Lysinibacillus sphaericus]|uniref:Phosphatase n=2 Tax=Lysinibacillus TaxID=400634 RepID=A0A2S0K3E9_LYSSH|nr:MULTISPECIES: HAD hydrolase-like protein [Lysinibacillus]AVK97871.1 phosphatase [Lysinibacillus sphaericus]MCS1380984.1 HAD hydrolase-like protein [Lysinibacillus sphaericus]MED4543365.1 HAD hydrolase-like protein [Lysinibacillus sphaericus]TKI21106.1 HAD family hydrolase [Lysinibacillus sphaericus]TKI48257.1 HAD family hydrolase [Lysinibacillus tabacifolii]
MKYNIELAVFDLAGTLVEDNNGVRDCLYKAAVDYGLNVTKDEISNHMGTNKIHLYQFLIARTKGNFIDFKNFEVDIDNSTQDEAVKLYDRYTEYMIAYYQENCREIEGATETLKWCKENGIKVATGTGFHKEINSVIMESLGWVKDGLIDYAVDLDMVPEGKGRPAPFMIFKAMEYLNVQNVRNVIKIGDTPADMLEGYNAGCKAVIGVTQGSTPIEVWGKYYHTHVLDTVKELPALIESGKIV